MSRSTGPDPPPSAQGLLLYHRLRQQDPVAPADLAAAYLPWLVEWLRERHRRIDGHLTETAAHIALIDLIKNPGAYDPDRLALDAYLRMAARRDLLNLLQREQRHHTGRRDWNLVADDDDDGNILGRDDDPSLPLQLKDEEQRLAARVAAVTAGWATDERRVLQLILAGRTSTDEIAPEIGLAHLPPEEREVEVKRIRDRVHARWRRAGGEHE